MELEEMKKMWQQYDNALQQNRKLDEHIINTMLKDKSTNLIRRMMNFEYFGLAIVTILTIVYLPMWTHTGDYTNLFACYLFCLLILIASLVLGIYKIQFLSATDPGNLDVTKTAERIEKFRLLVARERAWGILSLPFVLFTFYVVVEYWVKGDNFFDNMAPHAFRLIIAFITGIACTIAIYNKVYFRSIRQIKNNIAEIEKFKNGTE